MSNTSARQETSGDSVLDERRSRHSSERDYPLSHFPIYYPTATSSFHKAVYCRSLMSLGHGFAPWSVGTASYPEAHFQQGVGIGDVGFIDKDGGFQFCFNIFHPPDHPIQDDNLPRNFRPIQPPLTEWKTQLSLNHFAPGTVLSSEGIAASRISESPLEIDFSSDARQGAVLILPEGASREDLVDVEPLHSYIKEHASDWYQFVNCYSDIALPRPIVNCTLFVVTGTDKAKVWNSAWFPSFEDELATSVRFKFIQKTVSERVWSDSNYVNMSTERSTTGNGNYPCALFLRGTYVALSAPNWKHGMAAIPSTIIPPYFIPSVPVSGRRSNVEKYLKRFRRSSRDDDGLPLEALFHPSFVLLQILLDVEPTAEIAVLDESVWTHLMNGRTLILAEFVKLVNNILDAYEITTTDGVARFVPKKPVVPTLKEKFETYLQFFFTGTTRSKSEQKALRKLKKILTKPPPLPRNFE